MGDPLAPPGPEGRAIPTTGSEVKGVWFVSMRSWLADQPDPQLLERVVRALPPAHRAALADPLPSEWYPEGALHAALGVVFRDVTHGDRAAFVALMEGCTEIGVSRFFRVLLRLSTPGFVLRQVPTMWRHIRRGRGEVRVREEDGVFVLEYSDFPWFADPLYEHLTVGSVRALVRIATGKAPAIRAEAAGDRLTLFVRPA